MIFLIEYSRHLGSIITIEVFSDQNREQAANARLEAELELGRKGLDHEVVLLEAASEEALRRTHRRYFEDPRSIASSS